PGGLEEPSEDRADSDAVGESANRGTQTADAAHDQVDVRAALGREVQRVDELGIGEAVELHDDASPGLSFARDEIEQLLAQHQRSDEQLAERALAAVAGEQIE